AGSAAIAPSAGSASAAIRRSSSRSDRVRSTARLSSTIRVALGDYPAPLPCAGPDGRPVRPPAPADGNPGQSLSILDPLAFTTYQSEPNALSPCPLAIPEPVSAEK